MEAGSVHSIVTDPPYGLGFMGKKWDELPPGEGWARECLRVLKPGGHLLAFGGTRTWHRLAVATEDAGFEIRDSIAWLYGTGFPKSLDVGTAIAKGAGSDDSAKVAQRWNGWGTALKPAFEPIIIGRKPLKGNVAENLQAHGTGALNVDACRVHVSEYDRENVKGRQFVGAPRSGSVYAQDEWTKTHMGGTKDIAYHDGGRWPPNALFDNSQAFELGESAKFFPTFKYQAKAPKAERPIVNGVSHPTVKPVELMRWLVRLVTPADGVVLDPFAGSGTTAEACVIEGFDCIAIEREGEYLPLIAARLDRMPMQLREEPDA